MTSSTPFAAPSGFVIPSSFVIFPGPRPLDIGERATDSRHIASLYTPEIAAEDYLLAARPTHDPPDLAQ